MSTRGLVGWVIDGEFHASYNHSDSYPEWLGSRMFELARTLNAYPHLKDALKNGLKTLIPVKNDETPPKEWQSFYCEVGLCNIDVLEQSFEDWYCLLHEAQGADLFYNVLNKKVYHFIEGKDFLKESLFCEWAWVLNFDTECLEVYKGFWKDPIKYNELISEEENVPGDDGYYPCERIRNTPFDALESEKWMLSACFKNGKKPLPIPKKMVPQDPGVLPPNKVENTKTAPKEKPEKKAKVKEESDKRSIAVHLDTFQIILMSAIRRRKKEEKSWGYAA